MTSTSMNFFKIKNVCLSFVYIALIWLIEIWMINDSRLSKHETLTLTIFFKTMKYTL
jgi:hypothetical protein